MVNARLACLLVVLVLAEVVDAAPLRIGIVADNSRRGFTEAMRAGMMAATREMERTAEPIALEWREPTKPGDRVAQAQLVNDLVAARIDAIVLDAIDRQVLRTPVEKAHRAGVPVIAIDSGVDGEGVGAIVATDNRAAGREAARLVGIAMNGRGGVLLLRYQIHAMKTEQREEGFIESLTREFPGMRLVASDYHAGPTVESATRVMETLLQRYADQIEAVFASSESGTLGTLAALRRAQLAAGKVKLFGSDDTGGALATALRNGDVQGFVAEDPVAMGRAALQLAVAQARAGRGMTTAAPIDFAVVTAAGRAIPALPPQRARAELDAPFVAPPCAPADRLPPLPRGVDSIVVPGLDLRLIAVAPGKFSRAPDITVRMTRAYWLGQCEITQRQWIALMETNPSDFRGDCLPVDNVTWADAMAFCERLTQRERAAGRVPSGYGYTLPTEAEWEYAARGGAALVTEVADLLESSWCATTSGAVQSASGVWRMSTHPVATKHANSWGFYDLGGNVAEWCLDWQDDYPPGDLADPRGPDHGTYRVLRGGSWWADVQNCRADSRHRGPPTRHHNALGFRVALSPLSP